MAKRLFVTEIPFDPEERRSSPLGSTQRHMQATYPSILTIGALALFSCENPADKTTDAKVGETVEKQPPNPQRGV
jgi:hypothetical protein